MHSSIYFLQGQKYTVESHSNTSHERTPHIKEYICKADRFFVPMSLDQPAISNK